MDEKTAARMRYGSSYEMDGTGSGSSEHNDKADPKWIDFLYMVSRSPFSMIEAQTIRIVRQFLPLRADHPLLN